MSDPRFEANRQKIIERNKRLQEGDIEVPSLYDPEDEEELGKFLMTEEEIAARRRLFYTRTLQDAPAAGRGTLRPDFDKTIGQPAARIGRGIQAYCTQCQAVFGSCGCFQAR